jgi:hypothetical protein
MGLFRRTALLLLAGMVAGTAVAEEEVAALISRTGDMADVAIRFACPNRLVGQAPSSDRSMTVIRLERLAPCPGSASAVRSASRPLGRELAALTRLDYTSGGGGQATLGLRFDREVEVTVGQAGDLRGLLVQVRVPAGSVPRAGVAPPALAGASPPAATGPTPGQVARAEERARLAAQPRPAPPPPPARYAVNLRSTTDPVDLSAATGVPQAAGQKLYVSDLTLDDQVWHRLRLGFFVTVAEAEAALVTLRDRYPDAWVTAVTDTERAGAGVPGPGADRKTALATAPGTGTLTAARATELLAEARAAIIGRNYARAIDRATAALAAPADIQAAEAREILGVARERAGDLEQAAAEYGQYLVDHPDGDGAGRVRQRLTALTTAREAPRESIRGGTVPEVDSGWEFSGGLSQFYWLDSLDFGGDAGTEEQSAVFSDANFVARRSGRRFDFESRATLGYTYDLSSGAGAPGDETRIYNLYADLHDRDLGLSARLGRQTLRNQGVLGRFDGAILSWDVAPSYRLNLLGGVPVYYPGDPPETDRTFWGASVDVLDLLDLVDVNVFVNIQEVDGISDRQSAGAEVRYFGAGRALTALVDYDFSYSELNSLVAVGNWTFGNGVTVSGQYDWRKAPYLTTENALIGQPASSIQELLLTYTEAEVRQLALDRSGAMQSLAFGVSAPVSARFEVSADVTTSSYEATPDSGGVRDTPDSDTLVYSWLSLTGTSLIREGDMTVFGLRYSDSGAFASTALFVDTRIPVGRNLRVNPKLLVSRREVSPGDLTEMLYRPGLRLLYRLDRRFRLELEGGGEFSSTDGATTSNDATGYYLYAGYTADF